MIELENSESDVVKKINGDTYTFCEKEHKHMLNGKLLAGVTTVLKVINPVNFDEDGNVSSKTDMLMAWAVKLAVQALAERAVVYCTADSKGKESILKECKSAHRSARESAGGYGTSVHNYLENLIKGGDITKIPEDADKQIDFAARFLNDKNVIRSEAHVFSKSMMVGGILDLLYEDKDCIWIADYKTSKSVHPEMFFQMGAYDLCVKELGYGKPIAGYKIIHLPKSGDCSVVDNTQVGFSMKACQEAFKSALNIYRISLGQYKELK